MSKAFTREDDDAPERPLRTPRLSALPPGTKNYLTEDGAQRMREELNHLLQLDNDAPSRSQRVIQLQQALQSAVVVEAPAPPHDQVRFGATVTIRRRDGSEDSYRIVGVDETDIDRGWVSWVSPIAKALLNARPGQRVRFKFPSGEEELEIMRVAYE